MLYRSHPSSRAESFQPKESSTAAFTSLSTIGVHIQVQQDRWIQSQCWCGRMSLSFHKITDIRAGRDPHRPLSPTPGSPKDHSKNQTMCRSMLCSTEFFSVVSEEKYILDQIWWIFAGKKQILCLIAYFLRDWYFFFFYTHKSFCFLVTKKTLILKVKWKGESSACHTAKRRTQVQHT